MAQCCIAVMAPKHTDPPPFQELNTLNLSVNGRLCFSSTQMILYRNGSVRSGLSKMYSEEVLNVWGFINLKNLGSMAEREVSRLQPTNLGLW